MKGFKIKVICNICQSNNVEMELAMNQGTGLLGLECRDCGNDNEGKYLMDKDLEDVTADK